MGADLYGNPPPPPPIWEQVRALHDYVQEARATIGRQRAKIESLEEGREHSDRLIAQQQRRIALLEEQLIKATC